MLRYPSQSSNCLGLWWSVMAATVALAALIALPTAASAGAVEVFVPCRNAHPQARVHPGGRLWAVSRLKVSRMSCRGR
jgi:hypothetical protein